MKTLLLSVLLLINSLASFSQITTPQIRAAFGVDGDLRSHYFNNFLQLGNDDWFNQKTGTIDTGRFVIDTTGAAAIVARYNSVPSSRDLPFYRSMRYPQYTVVNNRLLMDAIMIRDYHGDDSTVFASGSNKNGDNPNDWSCPVSQGIPDKNDILDMFIHIRRAGPNSIDSLWMFGGLSLDNTSGNRYFDFEMYQTDIYYDRASRRFYGYGPDAGHTSWQLDAAGNVTSTGDIIFNASYQSSSLSAIQARIWVHVSTLSITPSQFSWSGQFDGAYNGCPYGYASIVPKTAGAYYTGLQCPNNTWGGPFSIVLQDNSLQTHYTGGQFVEFSVNLTKLGLDPVNLLGGNVCGMPFRRMLVKTRASSSFTAELKDFVGPFDLFLAPRAELETGTPYICDTGSIASIYVRNPSPSSVYQWSTPNGNIVGSTVGPSITVDRPGIYMVTQFLQAGCSEYASDTITINSFGTCSVLADTRYIIKGVIRQGEAILNWNESADNAVGQFGIERSTDGMNFIPAGTVNAKETGEYDFREDVSGINSLYIYYRLKYRLPGKSYAYTSVARLSQSQQGLQQLVISPNPVVDQVQIRLESPVREMVHIQIHGIDGKIIREQDALLDTGMNMIPIDNLGRYPRGIYQVVVLTGKAVLIRKMMLVR